MIFEAFSSCCQLFPPLFNFSLKGKTFCSFDLSANSFAYQKNTHNIIERRIRWDLCLQWIYSRSSWTFNFNAQLSILLSSLFPFQRFHSCALFSFFVIIKTVHNWMSRLLIFFFHRFNLSHNSVSILTTCCIESLIEKIHRLLGNDFLQFRFRLER